MKTLLNIIGKAARIAANTGARVAALAQPGEVLVSRPSKTSSPDPGTGIRLYGKRWAVPLVP